MKHIDIDKFKKRETFPNGFKYIHPSIVHLKDGSTAHVYERFAIGLSFREVLLEHFYSSPLITFAPFNGNILDIVSKEEIESAQKEGRENSKMEWSNYTQQYAAWQQNEHDRLERGEMPTRFVKQ